MSDDPSVEFIEYHIDNSFKQEMATYLIKDLYWLEMEEGARAIARMSEPTEKGLEDTNLLCLFPPFFDKEANK
jgi:hypothetical protein